MCGRIAVFSIWRRWGGTVRWIIFTKLWWGTCWSLEQRHDRHSWEIKEGPMKSIGARKMFSLVMYYCLEIIQTYLICIIMYIWKASCIFEMMKGNMILLLLISNIMEHENTRFDCWPQKYSGINSHGWNMDQWVSESMYLLKNQKSRITSHVWIFFVTI